jgi:hypothetical protein
MNKAASDCLGKEQYTEKEVKLEKIWRGNFCHFYKCPLCGKYHRTSKGVKHGRNQ